VKVRHSPNILSAWLYWKLSKKKQQQKQILPNEVRVELFEKDKGIAPGQYAAFYWGKYCIGSGVIVRNMF